ncbi:MAG: hypothetical protein MR784_03995 [Rikenellaceae bacterium]|nr:hypothetical protein [Rikenellaceae bacterium]
MKTNFRFLALSAAILSMFTACQREELEQNQKPETLTHSVTFVAGAPETKTIATIIEDKTVNYSWTAEDVNRFTVYENGEAATKTECRLADGVMTIKATFEGSKAPKTASYVAVVNSSNDSQIITSEAYDEGADILVSKAVSTFDGNNGVKLQFKREVAIAKMTLKGLDPEEVIDLVTVSSTADIAGSYGVNGWASPAKTAIEIASESYMLDGTEGSYSIEANASGEAVVWFTCIPQTDATLTVKVVAADGDTYTKEFRKPITLTCGDVKAFGVAMTKDVVEVPNETYNRVTSQSELEDGEYVIGMALNSDLNKIKYLVNTTKAKPGCTDITGDISVSGDGKTINLNPTTITNAKWLIESVDGGFSISSMTEEPAGLATTSASDGLTTQTTYLGTAWSITVDGETNACTMKYVPTSRYLNVYSLANPRTYTLASTNNNGKIYLYKRYDPRTALATPTNLTVSAEKAVSWNAVEGAASYVLTIGTEEYPCTSNSYDASAIEDEYYDVAVVAVPSDTENYKNSAAATLTDAKFGTPKLPTPTLKEGTVEEFSVNATWTVDSRAKSGYNCELYNGETKVGDSKTVTIGSVTFDNLNDGVTYTVKVNAIAVEGTKAYAASDVATIDLKTKGTVTLSQITEAGTYTVKNVTVHAVISKSTAVIGDGTAYFYMYKSNHGLDVGNTFTIGGEVKEYNSVLQFNSPTISNKATGSEPAYENPVEANEEYLTSYALSPVTEYIHAKGTQSGRSITVGSKILNLSEENTATDGKDVEVYGFVYGYNSSSSYAYFYATSIAEDPTAPKLSVTPTSKTWASNETDAAVFTVTTNAEGEKDWSVTYDAIGWATVAVDKTAGTITVTPNDANTTDTAREATLTVSHSTGTLSETITLTQKAAGKVQKTAQITFGTNKEKIDGASVTANDDCGNSWTITTVGTTSFTANTDYYQVGSSKKPAESITFITTLPSDAEVSSLEAKFGGFSGTAGTVSLKVGDTSVGSGLLNAGNDVTVSSTSTDKGNVVTVSVTGISKGVKCYYIKVGYQTAE